MFIDSLTAQTQFLRSKMIDRTDQPVTPPVNPCAGHLQRHDPVVILPFRQCQFLPGFKRNPGITGAQPFYAEFTLQKSIHGIQGTETALGMTDKLVGITCRMIVSPEINPATADSIMRLRAFELPFPIRSGNSDQEKILFARNPSSGNQMQMFLQFSTGKLLNGVRWICRPYLDLRQRPFRCNKCP